MMRVMRQVAGHDGRADADIVLIGAGLSGAAFAAHLLRDHPRLRGRLSIVEPSARLGAGLAYGTTDPVHRTNVAAGRMSLFPELAGHFAEWLEASGEPARDPAATGPDGRVHARRRAYGDYVDATLRAQIVASGLEVRHLRLRATGAARRAGGGWRIDLEDGPPLDARMLVLAVGHVAPELPAALRGVGSDPRVLADPWDGAALALALARTRTDAPVLVLGTGLTGCDVIAGLRARGHRGHILAVSRRGLLPRPRTSLPVAASGDFSSMPATTSLALLRRVRRQVAMQAAAGRPWEDVIDAIRTQAGVIWGALPISERQRLLRHLRPFWDVHRFQCAPQIERVIRDGQAAGWLSVLAATHEAAVAGPDGIRVRLRRRGQRVAEDVLVAAVVNCTGPGHRSVVATHPVLASLARAGALRADPCRLGIEVDQRSRVVARDGQAWPDLFVAGPLARGTHGELMGLPQVSLQPRAVAALVAAGLDAPVPA